MINKKTSVLETYSLILIDMLAVIFSFLIARLFRFSATGVQSVDTENILCALSSLLLAFYMVYLLNITENFLQEAILLNLLRYSNTSSFFY